MFLSPLKSCDRSKVMPGLVSGIRAVPAQDGGTSPAMTLSPVDLEICYPISLSVLSRQEPTKESPRCHRQRGFSVSVRPGLVPGIHVLPARDGRDEPGYDAR
jgi:hypothetical protein